MALISRETSHGTEYVELTDPDLSNSRRGTYLMSAAFNGNEKRVKRLLKAGADVNLVDIEGRTALHFAMMYGRKSMVELLLAYGADQNILDKYGKTPFDLCGSHFRELPDSTRNAIKELLKQ